MRRAWNVLGLAAGLWLVAAGSCPAQSDTDSAISRYQARVTATQSEQPHWITPLVTVTPRLEQEFRSDFVRQIDSSGKPLAVICHGPWLLVSAGLVKGKTMTSYYTIQDDIRNAGGHWVDQEMVRDGTWVSSRSPKDLPAFNTGMVELFAGSKVTLQQ